MKIERKSIEESIKKVITDDFFEAEDPNITVVKVVDKIWPIIEYLMNEIKD